MSSNQIKVELQAVYGGDKEIAESAWTSSLDYQKKKTRTDEDVKRVINMLADNKHSVPFESVIFRFWLKIPIAIDRQVEKHRISSQNGMSGRYRTMPDEFLNISDDIKNICSKVSNEEFWKDYERLCSQSNTWYQKQMKFFKQEKDLNLISNDEYKRVREFFRGVLPQHNMTEKIMTINLRSWCNFIKLRNSEHAQKEIQQVAQMMLQAVKESNKCPIAIEALERNNWTI